MDTAYGILPRTVENEVETKMHNEIETEILLRLIRLIEETSARP